MKREDQLRYKAPLLNLWQRLLKELDRVEEALREDISPPGDVSTVPTHPADRAVEGADEQIVIAQSEVRMLDDVQRALAQIDAGSYGVCQDCGQEISRDRLEAVPYTAWCVECARKHDHGLPSPSTPRPWPASG